MEGNALPDLTVVKPSRPSALARLVDEYLADCAARGLSAKTVRMSYGYPLQQVFLPWAAEQGVGEPGQLTTALLNRLSTDLQGAGGKRGALSRASVWTYMKAIKRFIDWANDPKGGAVTIQATANLPKLPSRPELEILTREEIQRIEDAADNQRDGLIVRLLADTGIRVGELVGLRTSDLVENGREHYIRVRGKTGPRQVPIMPALSRRLARYIERVRPGDAAGDRIFLSRRRSPRSGEYEALTESGVQQLVRELAEQAGIKKRVHPHLFRHSAATYMLQRGMDSLVVAQVLGHSSLAMIQRVYQHLSDSDRHAAMMAILRDERS